MKYKIIKTGLLALALSAIFTACKKDIDVGILNTGGGYYADNGTALKDAADFPIGTAINFTPLTAEPKFAEVTKRDFDQVVFGYEMKHGAIVQNNGTYNFTNTDAMVAAVGAMDIFGHTLLWHQNQNAAYLKNFAGITLPAATEQLANPGFESALTGWSVFNSGNPAGTSTITTTTVAGEIRTGATAMKVINPIGYPGSQWRVQIASILVPTTVGTQYTFSYWIKAAAGGGTVRLSTADQTGGNAQYQGDQAITTAFSQVTWTITANSAQTRFLFDMGQSANTYYVDDASFKQVLIAPGGPAIAAQLDIAMSNWISTMVNKYKSKVKAWDVVNEPFADNPVALRNNTNTSATPADVLVWSNYLGRDAALKAFNYAKAADPAADLYINDYNLETNPAKLDSLIAFVTELKARGAKIDGIGTQVHTSTTPNAAGIDNMMKKLAATGLKIRISEMDVRTSTTGKLVKAIEVDQPVIYKYIVQSYMKNIPKPQQAGITVWGVNDKNSWLYNSGAEFPLLYDDTYNKKPAYGGFLQGLKLQ